MTLTEKDAAPGGKGEEREPAAGAPDAPDVPGPTAPDETASNNPGRVVQLLVGLALITALFIVMGWGDLLLFIVILVAIVMLHELGHFVTAKRAGMKVTEYFVGFGPRLWSVRRGETEYGVKAIPAGGYVRITGFTSTEEVPEEDEARAYRQQPFHQRIVVASAGSVMHILIAFVLALIVVFGYGQLTNNYTVGSLEHWPGKATPAALAGLKAGDTIVSINGKTFDNPNAMTDTVRASVGKPLTVGVERDGRLIHLHATPESGKGIEVGGQKLENRGYLGVEIETATTPVNPLTAPGAALSTMWQVTDQEAHGIGQLFSPSGFDSIWHQLTNSKYAASAADNPGLGGTPGVDRGDRPPRRTGGTEQLLRSADVARRHQHRLRVAQHAARWSPSTAGTWRSRPTSGCVPRRDRRITGPTSPSSSRWRRSSSGSWRSWPSRPSISTSHIRSSCRTDRRGALLLPPVVPPADTSHHPGRREHR